MRVASSGAHGLVAVGGASELGSVANFGWIAPQAANRSANPAGDVLSRAAQGDVAGRGSCSELPEGP
jgi:hypothetical protein